jgi:hypothetical protein
MMLAVEFRSIAANETGRRERRPVTFRSRRRASAVRPK